MEKLRPLFTAIFVACLLQIVVHSSESPLAPALYVMGDSLLDSGNNNLLPTLARANFFPYGAGFAAGATGRFTNGKTVADFIAESLGLPFPPPYLGLRGSPTPLTGLDYASSSCGILHETGNDLGKCLSLAEQVSMFNQTVMELSTHYNNSEELSDYLSKSIFLVAIGNNDYINNYLQPSFYNTSKTYSPTEFAKLLVDAVSVQFQRLYDLGARKVVMFDIGPIGCIPMFTKQSKRTNESCVNDYNQLAMMFNEQLDATLKTLTTALHDSQFILGHAHWLGYDIAINPSTYGLTDSSNPCCITWNGASACIPEIFPCRDADKHYFWDGYHGTEAFYRIIATRCINGTDVCLPKNIMDLVRS